MQNDTPKCGLLETEKGNYEDHLSKNGYLWHETDYQHDDYEHQHERSQLTYVEEGYQYIHIGNSIYLVPQNHVIWIPSQTKHRTSSEAPAVNLMVVLFKNQMDADFYNEVHVFPCPPVLKEMLNYAKKWNKNIQSDQEEEVFLHAILNSLPGFCNDDKTLKIPIPSDSRLIPVCNYINIHYAHGLNIDDLASLAAMSPRNLQRIFNQETGITIQKYVQLIRILKSIELIDSKQFTLKQIAFMVGYKSLSAFTNSYLSILKKRPKSMVSKK